MFGAGRVPNFAKNLTMRKKFVFLLITISALACKPSLRDANWQPTVSPKMTQWFTSLNYTGSKNVTPYALGYPPWYMNQNVPKTDLSREIVELGRFLFYDKSLSADSTVACASCHQQKFSFSDNRRFSIGVKGRVGHRNSMQLLNLVSDRRFFWDGRASSLEEQVLMPIEDSNEMDLPLDEAIARLARHTIYPLLFERAYGNKIITREKLADALSQFVKSIVSYSSADDYLTSHEDRRIHWKDVPQFARTLLPVYKKGFGLLNCGPCHAIAARSGQNTFDDTGLDADPKDFGYFAVTKNEIDKGKFKIPVFRNLAVTGPYMHDGRFNTLKEVIKHYRSGMHRRPNISPMYLDKDKKIITESLTDADEAILEETIKLTHDEQVLTDPKYSDPF